jgi:hypothetical protein
MQFGMVATRKWVEVPDSTLITQSSITRSEQKATTLTDFITSLQFSYNFNFGYLKYILYFISFYTIILQKIQTNKDMNSIIVG